MKLIKKEVIIDKINKQMCIVTKIIYIFANQFKKLMYSYL